MSAFFLEYGIGHGSPASDENDNISKGTPRINPDPAPHFGTQAPFFKQNHWGGCRPGGMRWGVCADPGRPKRSQSPPGGDFAYAPGMRQPMRQPRPSQRILAAMPGEPLGGLLGTLWTPPGPSHSRLSHERGDQKHKIAVFEELRPKFPQRDPTIEISIFLQTS